MKVSNSSEIRIKLSTDIPELKLKDNLQSMIIKSSMTRKELSNFIKKITKYQGSKELEFFINQKLFNDNNQVLSVFIAEEGIESEEQIINVFYTFQMDEPKLIDSKKQDEWIKKVVKFSNHPEVFTAGLFNSEVNFYDSKSHEKLDVVVLNENDDADYLFLNDYSLLDVGSKDGYLVVKAIRDNDYSLLFNEVVVNESQTQTEGKRKNSISKEQTNLNKITVSNSEYVGEKRKNVTKIDVNKSSKGVFATGTKNGQVEFYKINNYEFKNSSSKQIDKKNKQRFKDSSKQTILPSGQVKTSVNEVTALKWINENFVVSGDLEYIKVINSDSLSLLHQINVNCHLVTSLDTIGNNVILSSHDNGSFKIWDITANNSLINNTNRAHKGFVSNIKSLTNNVFLTTGYDGDAKLWDMRKPNTCYFDIIKSKDLKENKIFGADLLNTKDILEFNKLVVGGSDSMLNFYSIDV
jgi:hypothetical protein